MPRRAVFIKDCGEVAKPGVTIYQQQHHGTASSVAVAIEVAEGERVLCVNPLFL